MKDCDCGIRKALGLPDASQISVVVRDLGKAIEYFQQVLGIGPFVTPEVHYTDKYYLGNPCPDAEWLMGFASLGPVELEIIQPVKGPSIYQDFLDRGGEGLHHIGFDIANLDEMITRCSELGITVLASGRTQVGGFAYLDTTEAGTPLIELMQRSGRRA